MEVILALPAVFITVNQTAAMLEHILRNHFKQLDHLNIVNKVIGSRWLNIILFFNNYIVQIATCSHAKSKLIDFVHDEHHKVMQILLSFVTILPLYVMQCIKGALHLKSILGFDFAVLEHFLSFKMTPHLPKLINAFKFYDKKRSKIPVFFFIIFCVFSSTSKKVHSYKVQSFDLLHHIYA